MATEAQVVANRLNAQKSTGQRTGAGKAVVAQNAVRHGLLAQRVVHLVWRLRRAERLQAEVFDKMLVEEETDLVRKQIRSKRAQAIDGLAETDLTLGTAVSRDFVNYRVLDRLGLYERRLEYSLYRTMAELRRLRLLDRPPAESTPQPPSRTPERPLRQTNPISPLSAQKQGFERKNEGQQSVRQAKLVPSGRSEACSRIGSAGPLETERQEQRRTQT